MTSARNNTVRLFQKTEKQSIYHVNEDEKVTWICNVRTNFIKKRVCVSDIHPAYK